MNEHIAGEILAAYVDNALKGEQKVGVEAHLSRCRECRQALVEVSKIRDSRMKIPHEFLDRALKVPDKGVLEGKGSPAKKVLPLRLAFGIAAVFLVAVAMGYLFLLRGGGEMARTVDKEMPEQAGALEVYRSPAKAEGTMPARKEAAERTARSLEEEVLEEEQILEAQAESVNGLKSKKKLASRGGDSGPLPAAISGKKAEPAVASIEEERRRSTDAADRMRQGEQEGGVIGGVVGGVETLSEKEKTNEVKLTPSALPETRTEELNKNNDEIPRQAAVPVRTKGAALGDRKSLPPAAAPARDKRTVITGIRQSRSLFGGAGTAAGASIDAMQLFLAATGRAAAPRMLRSAASSLQPSIRIEGDIAPGDLIGPGFIDAWEWLPEGSALEVTIAADGTVKAVALLGEWEPGAAALAKAAAEKLAFSASARETRRAVLSRGPLN